MIFFDRTALIELALGSGVSVLFYCSRLSIKQAAGFVCLPLAALAAIRIYFISSFVPLSPRTKSDAI